LGIVPEEIAKQLRETLSQDLTISNLFHIMEEELPQRGVYITEKTVDYNAWAVVGAEFLLSAGLSVEGDSVTIEFRLFDVVQGAYIAGKRYRGSAKSVRLIAHRTADEIFYQLTGERGIFQTRIAFVADRTGNKEIYVMDFDGHNVEQVTRNGSINISPAWSPHGNSLLYTSFIRRNPDLYQVFLSTGNSILFSSVTGLNAAPDWSPNGQLIALMMRAKDNAEICLLKKDGTNPTRLTKSWANEASPSWSPDGKQIAFLSDRSGSPQIYIMDLRTKKSRRLTYEGSYNCSPAWSPRGDKIAFAGRLEGTFHIFTIRTDGTDLRKLTMTGSNESPSWAPNGRYIAFTCTRGGNPDIYIMTEDGGTSWRVTNTKSKETEPAWSPWLK
ncbi:MAG: Tol-Pal system beta propeller repeat protein TolB, partial [Methanobacteriota archaeon]